MHIVDIPSSSSDLLSPPPPVSLRRTVTTSDGAGTVSVLQPVAEGSPFTLSIQHPKRSLTIDLPHEARHRISTIVQAVVGVHNGADGQPEGGVDVDEAPLRWPGQLVSSSQRGSTQLLQPLACKQWHPNACGHHALHNALELLTAAKALANGEDVPPTCTEALRSEPQLWLRVSASMESLGTRWPVASFQGGTLDECHMRHLIDAMHLEGQLVILPSAARGDSDASHALAGLSRPGAAAFLLGSETHWLAAAVALPHSGGAVVLLADSHNKPLLEGRSSDELAKRALEQALPGFAERTRLSSKRYAQAPDAVLAELWRDGVPEWWKGSPKDPIWWRHRPLHVRTALLRGECEAVQGHLEHLVAAAARVPDDAPPSEGSEGVQEKKPEVAPGC